MNAKSRFFFEGPISSPSQVNLNEEQTRHAKSVLRLEPGAQIEIVNGKGLLAQARLESITKTAATCTIHSVESFECPFHLNLVLGISKGKALDFIIHKAAEIGVRSLLPIQTQHSLATKDFNQERWSRVLQEVIKQNQSLFLPQLLTPVRMEEWLSRRDKSQALFFCDENARSEKTPELRANSPIELLVGAEGGFSEDERKSIAAHNHHLLSLGANRLRTETAAFTACIVLKQKLGEL